MLPDLVTCTHSSPGGASGILAFKRFARPGAPQIDVMYALCPGCSAEVFKALAAVPGLEFPKGRVPK